MSLENALSNLTPNEGDVIKGQNGFATYSGTAWTGSLKILEPGRGYMYQNNGDEALILIYPTAENVVQPTVRLQNPAGLSSHFAKKNPGTVHWSVSQIVFKKQ